MQSRPYEITVLRKYYFDEPVSKNTVKYFDCTPGLHPSTGSVNKFVYQWRTRSQGILSVIYCLEGISLSEAVCCDSDNHLKSILFSKLTEYYCKCRNDCKYLIVFVLLFLCYIEKILNYKCRLTLNTKSIQLNSIESAIHNVETCIALHYWLRDSIIVYVSSLNHLGKVVQFITKLKTSYVLNGIDISSDMEVDEGLKHFSEKNPLIKEETLDLSYESEYSTVIKNVQNMKEPECAQVNNSFNCINHNDKNDNKYGNSVEMVANGDVVNCHSGNNIPDEKKIIDNVNCTVIDGNLLDGIKKEVFNCNEVNGTDFKSNKINENESVEEESIKKVIKDEKNVNSCNIKTNDCNAEKEKIKSKNHSGSNSTSHSVSSKKGDESWSHHSSSSSSSSRSKYKDYKSSSHRSSSSSKSCSERSKTNDGDKSKYDSSDKKKSSRSCHHKSDEKCHCKSHHHSRHHSKSKKFQSVKTQCSADEIAYELRTIKNDIANPYFTRVPWVPHPQLANLKYGRYYRIEVDRNGGASVVHLYMDEISHLTESQMKECAVEFIKLSYSEDENECAYHVMGIVHGAAAYLPDLVDYMADHYPTLTVKTGSLASRDNHTTTMSQYRDEVYKTYSNGTFRYAPLDQLSICGVLGEEVGAYFPDFVARLEQSPFMKPVMPWSSLSVVETDNPRESNDGPIFWVRPGEQMLPANEALKESARPKKRRNNELDNLAYIAGSRSSEARESLFMDRTKAHADQVGVDYGLSNTAPTAAVGVLKSVNCGHPEHGNRATKDVVAFHAQDYNELLEILMLDLYEPPQTQCTKWIEVSKLNTLRREGIRYAHVQLHDNDVYYLPRKIIHQFQTISSVASVAWHIRYKDYFSIMGAPNLHTPTGINKGQVFYEKKNVAVYYPPVCENDLLASVTNPGSPLSKTPKKFEKLKDYSPFKHSPRKNHKIHSPRTSSKKEKESDSVPQTPNKKEPESASHDKSNSARKDRSKSDEDGSSLKRERESSSSKKHESSSSGSHSSTKKERKENHESSSGHRKEVKNLEAEFDSVKKSKSKSSKSKSDHEGSRRRSDESKSDSSSRHKRHDEFKSKSHSKRDKSSPHKNSNGGTTTTTTTTENSNSRIDEKHEKVISLKRRNSDSQDSSSSSSKKSKEEIRPKEMVLENGESSSANASEEIASVSDSDVNLTNSNCVSSEPMELDGNEKLIDESVKPIEEERLTVPDCETNAFPVKNVAESIDLIVENASSPPPPPPPPLPPPLPPQASACGESNGIVEPDSNPPLPSSSPPSNPPLPPSSPLPEDRRKEESSSSPSEGNQNHQDYSTTSSKDKNNELGKKVKRKIARKESESYDLLGDIMSQMDKKK